MHGERQAAVPGVTGVLDRRWVGGLGLEQREDEERLRHAGPGLSGLTTVA